MKKTLLIAAFAAPSLWAAHASAQACVTDADCDDGQACVFYEDCDDADCDTEADPWCCPGICETLGGGVIVDDLECESDADCGDGWVCERGTEEICSAMACAPGEECDDEVICDTWEYAYCAPDLIECSTDADCPDDLTCFTYEYEECSGGAPPCVDGEDCPDAEEFEDDCSTYSESFCAPAYIGPCEADADCGDGFACVPEEVCWCSGSEGGSSGGSSGSGGGEVPPPLPDDPDAPDAGSGSDDDFGDDDDGDFGDREPSEEDCGCEPTGDFYCEPQEITCADDSECPDGWACESWGDSSVACWEDESGEVICDEPETDDTMYCIPPEWGIWGASGSGGYDDLAAEASGADEEGRSTGGLTPVNQNDDSASGGDGSSDTSRPNAGGCSAAPASGAGAGLLALLGLAATFRRRR